MITITVMTALTGCSGRKALNAETFQALAEKQGLTTEDLTSDFSEDSVEACILATGEDADCEFYILHDEESIEVLWESAEAMIGERPELNDSASDAAGSVPDPLMGETETGYAYASQIDMTFLYIEGKDEGTVKALANAFNY